MSLSFSDLVVCFNSTGEPVGRPESSPRRGGSGELGAKRVDIPPVQRQRETPHTPPYVLQLKQR